MSYAPIYAKLRDLEERLIKIETLPPAISLPNAANTVVDLSTGIDLTNLLNDCALNSSSITQLSSDIAMLATKEELAPLATKAELPDVSVLATKEELVPLATKAELPDVSVLATKEELVPLATKAELPDVSVLATKEELVPLATKEELVSKDELANLFVKFDNIINVVAQLNTRIDELYTKIQ